MILMIHVVELRKKERARRRHKELMARQALKPVPVVPQPSEWVPWQ